jgi:hypothetical protein
LELTAEFAYRFQFKMLRGTPSLERVLIELRSTSTLHKRTVSFKDLLQNTQDLTTLEGDDEALDLHLKNIRLPNLTDFALIGD